LKGRWRGPREKKFEPDGKRQVGDQKALPGMRTVRGGESRGGGKGGMAFKFQHVDSRGGRQGGTSRRWGDANCGADLGRGEREGTMKKKVEGR